MHRSLTSLSGLPLMTAAGVRLGEITDAFFEPFEQRILAFVVDWEPDTATLGPADLLPITQLLELNADLGTVADEIGISAGLDADQAGTAEGWVQMNLSLIDRIVKDATGKQVGHLVDLHFDPQDGSVEFYEVAESEQGASLMIAPHPQLELREDELVLPIEAIQAARRRGEPGVRGVTFIEAEAVEEAVGEEDLEVSHSAGADPT